MLKFRSAMVPVQAVGAKIVNIIFMMKRFGAFAVKGPFSLDTALLVIIACYGVFELYELVTLPVEFDASRRALAWVQERGIVNRQEHDMAKDALKWAALTYVVAAIGALATLLYFVMLFLGRRE